MSTPTSYFVTVDSEYRDTNKYVNPTDFSVKFLNVATGPNPIVYGNPVPTPINSSFLMPLQINPDFYNANFRVLNGSIIHFEYIGPNTYIACGLINALTAPQTFVFQNVTSTSTTVYVTLLSTNFTAITSNVYIICLVYSTATGLFSLSWINYTNSLIAHTNNRSTFCLDTNNNIYFLFDYISNFYLYTSTSSTPPLVASSIPLFTTYVTNPNAGLSSLFSTIFTSSTGALYNFTPPTAWGYHLINSSTDNISTSYENGRSNILTDNALNIYISGNTTPLSLNVSTVINSTHYTSSNIPTSTGTTSCTGCGIGFINKIINNGTPSWVTHISGTGTSSTGLAGGIISNVVIDSSLSNLYITGGWTSALRTYDPNYNTSGPSSNYITSNYSNYNGFLAKFSLLDTQSNFQWVMPTYGTNNIYFQQVKYIATTNTVAFVMYFLSPVMNLYTIQTSSSGTVYPNPSTSILNIPNPVEVSTAALIAITPAGLLSYSCKLYTNDTTARYVKLVDLVVDELSTSLDFPNTIHILGTTNSNNLQLVDSSGLNKQVTYTNIASTQTCFFTYSFDLSGNYISSNRAELPVGMTGSAPEIKSFSANNRVVYYPTVSSPTLGSSIYFYNLDGSLGTTVNNYTGPNINNCIFVQYYYNNGYIDSDYQIYPKIILQNYFSTGTNPLFNTNQLTNYSLFIQGALINPYSGTTTQLAPQPSLYAGVLNNNFIIRRNYNTGTGTNVLVLNSSFDTSKIIRNNLSYPGTVGVTGTYWAGNISPTPLPTVIAFNNTVPLSGSGITVGGVYGTYLNTGSTGGYLVFPSTGTNGTGTYVQVTSITSNSAGLYTLNMSSANLALLSSAYSPSAGSYPSVYYTSYNLNSSNILPWNPQTIYEQTYYTLQLNSLTIPNRAILTSSLTATNNYASLRSINDFSYIVLEVFNTNDNGVINTGILNNIFTNNTNFVVETQGGKTTFQIPVQNISISSNTNFITFSGSIVPTIGFQSNYN